ncbi:MAG: tRNA adenosine(34) deaminase TadA [Lachnospiraceae bacterium]|nr:tRNA adenosine(34) deaminase TadA [Lachnospiraceae bacterium]
MRSSPDEKFMRAALAQARLALKHGEVPIGCVIVSDGKIVARGYNRRNTDKTTLSHAELIAINRASKKLGDWRLEGCTLYVTLEPCQMCSGAIVQARIDRVVMGTMNPKAGCAGSILNILQMDAFNHQVEITSGVLKEECTAVLQEFFKDLRIRNHEEKLKRAEDTDLPKGKI